MLSQFSPEHLVGHGREFKGLGLRASTCCANLSFSILQMFCKVGDAQGGSEDVNSDRGVQQHHPHVCPKKDPISFPCNAYMSL